MNPSTVLIYTLPLFVIAHFIEIGIMAIYCDICPRACCKMGKHMLSDPRRGFAGVKLAGLPIVFSAILTYDADADKVYRVTIIDELGV